LLTAAAVLGRVFDLGLLAGVTGVSTDRVIELLESAMHEGFITDSDSPVGFFTFNHALTREAVLSWLSSARRSLLHGRVVRALEEQHGPATGIHAAELAHHAYLAGEDNRKLARYTLDAAENLMAEHAPEQALELLDRAMRSSEADPPGPDRDRDIAALCYAKARALGLTTVKEEAAGYLIRAFEIYKRLGENEKAVQIAITPTNAALRFGSSPVWTQAHRGLRELREPALALAAPGSIQHGWLLCHRAGARDRELALAIARRHGDRALHMWALVRIGISHVSAGQFNRGRDELTQALALAESLRDHTGIEQSHFWSHYVCKITGDALGAQSHLHGMLDNARAARSRLMLYKAHRVAANFQLIRGEWDACRASVAENLGMPFADRQVYDSQMALVDLALIALYTRGLSAAQEYLDRLKEEYPDQGLPPFIALAAPKIARMTGDSSIMELAIPVLSRAPGEAQMRSLPYSWPALARACALATVAGVNEDKAQAETYLDHLKGLRGTLAPPNPLGQPTRGVCGFLCLTTGRVDEAVQHYEEAVAFCREAGYRPELAWALYECARARLERNRAEDLVRAAELLQQGRDLASELDMRPLLGRIDGILVRPGSLVGLTDRQVEVLRLVARGLTNREIGEALFISQGTVARHMHNILDRTGMANRAELTAYAIRHGLVE
jgi:DNA-binding CsgD family transcriptional regulator/tetratricopeptide (TPR) repeat protein